MTRELWRTIKRLSWQDADKLLKSVYEPHYEHLIEYNMKKFMADLFTALVDRFPEIMTGDILHSISVDAMEYERGIETPEELIVKLVERTGFNIHQPVEEQPQTYIPKENAYEEKGSETVEQ